MQPSWLSRKAYVPNIGTHGTTRQWFAVDYQPPIKPFLCWILDVIMNEVIVKAARVCFVEARKVSCAILPLDEYGTGVNVKHVTRKTLG